MELHHRDQPIRVISRQFVASSHVTLQPLLHLVLHTDCGRVPNLRDGMGAAWLDELGWDRTGRAGLDELGCVRLGLVG